MTINAWIAYVIAGAYLVLLGALAVVLVINADLRAAIAADDAAKSLLYAQNKEWAEKMAARDTALAAIKAADAANAKAIARAEKKAVFGAGQLTHRAAAIAEPKFPGSECDQVIALDRFYWGEKP